jgi:hypothetical protein
MKLRSSTKIALGFVAIAVLLFGGYRVVTSRMVANIDLPPVVPGQVNLVGIDAGSGYSIIVANQIAQLVQVEGGFESSDSGGMEGATSGAIKKRIPLREMMGALQGDPESLGRFVMILNEIREDESWPTVRVVWTMEDLEAAFEGDPELERKLVQDLNMELDGTPLSSLRPASLENGIMVDYPVPMNVKVGGKQQVVVARIQKPYKPRLMRAVEAKLADQRVTRESQAGYYAEAAQALLQDPAQKEDVRTSVRRFYSEDSVAYLSDKPQRILSSAEVIISDKHIAGATQSSYELSDGPRYDINVKMTDEGRKRLWKYSLNKVGSQILLIADGIAIAAPRIQHPLTQQELSIKGMRDEVLVKEALELLHQAKAE